MLWTPDPIRTSAHHTSRVREAGFARNDPECQSVSLPATASCRHVVRSSDGSAKLSSIPGIVAREAARFGPILRGTAAVAADDLGPRCCAVPNADFVVSGA